ncbi:MAG TPA: YggS family pyridoxal phosphate-dependent enzyme [Alphaproteobacteria bacterium]
MNEVAANIAAIREKMKKAGAGPGVNLVAVSKLQPEDRVRAALGSGHRLFGENRVQEAEARWADLKKEFPDIRLHLIGHLQTNKAKDAVGLFDCIETVDSAKLATALAAEMKKQNRTLPCFIQVNTGEEPQKGGVIPAELPELLDECKKLNLEITGLMCIPPENEPPALHFALLKKLSVRHGLKDLSMGMSADFEKAIPLGATYIRVGTALFGVRV